MDLYLQFGHNMRPVCLDLIDHWGGGTVVLSPRDQTPDQLKRVAQEIHAKAGGRVLLDPQWYFPRADHEKLSSHDFWPLSYDSHVFWATDGTDTLMESLRHLDDELNCEEIVVPGTFATVVNGEWIDRQQQLLESAVEAGFDKPLIATLALSEDAIRSEDQMEMVVEMAEQMQCSGYYLVCKPPEDEYLSTDPAWLAGVLDLSAALRLLPGGRSVILGSANHQWLIGAAAAVNAICSGNFLNVRGFSQSRFFVQEPEVKRKAKWYYCGRALSEFRIPYLDVAFNMNCIESLATRPPLDGSYASQLFAGDLPSSADFGERDSFLHYLALLRSQVRRARKSTYDATVETLVAKVHTATALLQELQGTGVYAEQRSFHAAADATLSALAQLGQTRAPVLRHVWGNL